MLLQSGFSRPLALTIHFAVLLTVVGYATYHLLYASKLIGVLSVLSGIMLLLSAASLMRGSQGGIFTQLFVLSIAGALLATCYVHGIRGLALVFPLITGLFYTFRFRVALWMGAVVAAISLLTALNVTEPAMVARFAVAMTLTLLFSAAFVTLVNRQRVEIEREAGEDYLTGVRNRRSFNNWLDREIPRAIEQRRQLALLYIDLDDFKRINDAYGHSAGDLLLQAASQRIQDGVRASDRLGLVQPGSQFARLAGDEFSLVLMNVEDAQEVEAVTERLLDTLAAPFLIDGLPIEVNASVGIAMSGSDGNDFETLLRNADAAMYQAKRDGKRRFQFFNAELARTITLENGIEQALKEAIAQRAFELVYMPIYAADTLAVKGVEVLLRSSNHALASVPTEQYIRIAEERGLIKQIDLIVLDLALDKLEQTRHMPAFSQLFMCINISAQELMNPQFVSEVSARLATHDVDPSRVELEITETSLVAENAQAIAMLTELKGLGLRLSLDDFGTGYTAFNQLAAYPVDVLKIDRSFVGNIGQNDMVRGSMVNVILTLADLYHLSIVAEGVENQEQLDYLQKRNCDFVQGYFLSEPLGWDDFAEHVMETLEALPPAPQKSLQDTWF